MYSFYNLRAHIARTLLIVVAGLALLICVSPSALASSTASIMLSPTSGSPLARVKITGTGFGSSESLTITFDARSVGSTTSSSTGTFSTTFSVPIDALPSNYAGNHTVQALGQKSGRSAQAPFTVETNWSMAGFDAQGTKNNVLENMLSSGNVAKLLPGWNFGTSGRYPGSCPIVVNGIAYMGSSDGNLYALNAFSGVKVWSMPLGSRYTALSCPAVVKGILYIGTNAGSLYALNARTGTQIWSVNTLAQIESSPVVANNVVYISSFDGNLYAFNASTGAKLWSFATAAALTTSPVIAHGIVYLGAQDDHLYALNAATGAKLWSFTATAAVGSPAVTNGVVFAGSQDNHLYALNASTGAKMWSFATAGPVGSPAVGNGLVYAPSQDGHLYTLDASSGAEMWSSSTSGSLALANGVIYSASPDGHLYALDAFKGSLLWSNSIGPASSSPTVVNGIVYIVEVNSLNTFFMQTFCLC